MPTKAKPRPAAREADPLRDFTDRPCVTTEDRLEQIRALGRKVEEHVKFVARVGKLPGTSAEAKAKAVAAFHDRMVLLEGALARALDELRLG